MKPGWNKPHTHSNPTNLALFSRKITLYRFNRGGGLILYGGGLKWEQGAEPPPGPFTLTTDHDILITLLSSWFGIHGSV